MPEFMESLVNNILAPPPELDRAVLESKYQSINLPPKPFSIDTISPENTQIPETMAAYRHNLTLVLGGDLTNGADRVHVRGTLADAINPVVAELDKLEKDEQEAKKDVSDYRDRRISLESHHLIVQQSKKASEVLQEGREKKEAYDNASGEIRRTLQGRNQEIDSELLERGIRSSEDRKRIENFFALDQFVQRVPPPTDLTEVLPLIQSMGLTVNTLDELRVLMDQAQGNLSGYRVYQKLMRGYDTTVGGTTAHVDGVVELENKKNALDTAWNTEFQRLEAVRKEYHDKALEVHIALKDAKAQLTPRVNELTDALMELCDIQVYLSDHYVPSLPISSLIKLKNRVAEGEKAEDLHDTNQGAPSPIDGTLMEAFNAGKNIVAKVKRASDYLSDKHKFEKEAKTIQRGHSAREQLGNELDPSKRLRNWYINTRPIGYHPPLQIDRASDLVYGIVDDIESGNRTTLDKLTNELKPLVDTIKVLLGQGGADIKGYTL